MRTWFHFFLGRLLLWVIICLAFLPRWLQSAMATLVAQVRLRVKSRDRETLFENIARIYALPRHSAFAQHFAKQLFRHQALNALETSRAIWDLDSLEFLGLDELTKHVRDLNTDKCGYLVITAHLGSWELAGQLLARINHGIAGKRDSFYAFAKAPSSGALGFVADKMRKTMGVNVLNAESRSVGKEIFRILKQQKGSIGLVMDQKPEARRGPEVLFFGQPTPFVSGPAALAIRFHCPVLSLFVVREGYLKYRICSKILLQAEHHELDERKLTQRLASEIESYIRLYPEQWCWEYKRWKF